MLEPRRRSQLRLEPIPAIPTTRTTTRRTRRLCLNIETNGAGPLRTRRRRRSALPDPYYPPGYPPVYEPNPWGCGDWVSNDQLYSYGNLVNPLNRLYAGEEYEYPPVNGYVPPEEECDQELYTENSGQKAAGDLQNILMSLNGYLQRENFMEPENNAGLDTMGAPKDRRSQNNQIAVLIDVICDTVERLNNFVTPKNPLSRAPPPVQVLQLPVQPLLIPPILSKSALYPSKKPDSCPAKTKGKTFFDRIPWLGKERKRKRHAKAVVRAQSQSCSTEDLNTLPRILEASNSRDGKVPMNSNSPPPMKDSSTTMWCPMKCRKSCGSVRTQEQIQPSEEAKIPSPMTIRSPIKCGLDKTQEQKEPSENLGRVSSMTMTSSSLVRIQEQEKPFRDYTIPSLTQKQDKPYEDVKISSPMKSCSLVKTKEQKKPFEDVEISSPVKSCGLDKTQKQKKPFEDFKYPSSITIGAHIPPSLLRAPPPSMKSEDDTDKDLEIDLYHPRKPSSYSSSCDYHRHMGGNFIYSFVEEEELQIEPEEDHVDEDEWYQGASYKLAELEVEQEFFQEMQKQGDPLITSDQQTQTDDSRSVNIIVTTDKAVSTTDISGLPNPEPVKIVRICKRSSLKPRQRHTSISQRLKAKEVSHKVRFEREPIAPQIITIATSPMDWEETARSINRWCPKRWDSSSNSKEKRTHRVKSY